MSLMMQLCTEHNHRKSMQATMRQLENNLTNKDTPDTSRQTNHSRSVSAQNDKSNKVVTEKENTK